MQQVVFQARERDDGTWFVTSPNIPFYSVVAKAGDWNLVFELAAQDTKINGSDVVKPTQLSTRD